MPKNGGRRIIGIGDQLAGPGDGLGAAGREIVDSAFEGAGTGKGV